MRSFRYIFLGIMLAAAVLGLFIYLSSNKNSTNTTQKASEITPKPEDPALKATEATSSSNVNNYTITLAAENNSSQSGTAIFTESDGKTVVKVEILNPNLTSPQPAHIHVGKCPEVGAVKYALTSLVNGKSETILDFSLKELLTNLPLGLNVHKSAAELKIYTSCGDLKPL